MSTLRGPQPRTRDRGRPASFQEKKNKTTPIGLKEKKWLVLIRPPLAGFESTAGTVTNQGSVHETDTFKMLWLLFSLESYSGVPARESDSA
jgi:hypothetical protein